MQDERAAFAAGVFENGALSTTVEASITFVTKRISPLYDIADPNESPCAIVVWIWVLPCTEATDKPLLRLGCAPRAPLKSGPYDGSPDPLHDVRYVRASNAVWRRAVVGVPMNVRVPVLFKRLPDDNNC